VGTAGKWRRVALRRACVAALRSNGADSDFWGAGNHGRLDWSSSSRFRAAPDPFPAVPSMGGSTEAALGRDHFACNAARLRMSHCQWRVEPAVPTDHLWLTIHTSIPAYFERHL
jgi:hypothetical protein